MLLRDFLEAEPPPPSLPLERATDAVLTKLAASPRLACVTALDLTGGRVGARGAAALAASPYVTRLAALGLGQCHVGDAALVAVSTAPHAVALRSLDLHWNEVTPRGWSRFFAGVALPSLDDLRLGSNKLGAAGYRALCRSRLAPELVRLDLTSTWPKADGLRVLFESDFARLRSLKLALVELGAEDVPRLAAWPVLPRLSELDLSHNPLRPEGIAALLASGRLHAVERLGLRATNLDRRIREAVEWTPDGFQALAAARLPRLRSLDISAHRFSTEGARALGESGLLASVESLDLNGSVFDGSLEVLLASPGVAGLKRLVLRQCHLGDQDAQVLARSTCLPRLEDLDVTENPLGPAALEALRRRFGDGVELPKAVPPERAPPVKRGVAPPPRAARRPLSALADLDVARSFAGWKGHVPTRLIDASAELVKGAIRSLMDLGEGAGEEAQKEILRLCVEGLNALDREGRFISTLEAEDISGLIDEVAAHTALAGRADLAGEWRDW